ncbi:response regulator transcription factor [Leisingera methylohalidivorans]|uniref:Chemotaxis protein CheY n=1 Tax=Leisingera methylohalidivorans DSM 14336 TaxID=999552 RepID=V9VWA5_9RHOB|nr:response regulator transcription factor [Leisingera methylohalidivorans]AHD01162.1 chemotaxis protein CheY [Leisingera methylohalidivorans DSM 14336]
MKILLAEDDAATAETVTRFLTRENLNVSSTSFGEDAISLARHFDFDLILLDLRLPDRHGHDVIRDLRAAAIDTPVLVISGSDDLNSRVNSLKYGADDFMVKPVKYDELLARIFAIIRRSKGFSDSDIRAGDITLKLGKKFIEAKGRRIDLTNTEYNILELLLLQKGRVVLKNTILENLYTGPDYPGDKILDAYIYRLRKKIREATNCNDYIVTIRGEGFMICSPPGHRECA